MKNLLIYTSPSKKFGTEDGVLARIQIDNSLDLGWKKENLVMVTDFPYEYQGIHSLLVPDGLYYDFDRNANKAKVAVYLLEKGLIQPGELYWCHDFDAYENYRINESELELTNFDLGLTHYTYKSEWQFGSFFFRDSAQDILKLLDETTLTRRHASRNNEKNLTWLIKHNQIDSRRYKRLNVTYNFTKRYIPNIHPLAVKPIRVLHFRPSDKDALMTHTALEMFMYGKNRVKIPLMTDRLIEIFNNHGIR